MSTTRHLASDLMELGDCANRLADDVGCLDARQLADRLEHLCGAILAVLTWPEDRREPNGPLRERIVPRVEATRCPSVEVSHALAGALSAGATRIQLQLTH